MLPDTGCSLIAAGRLQGHETIMTSPVLRHQKALPTSASALAAGSIEVSQAEEYQADTEHAVDTAQ